MHKKQDSNHERVFKVFEPAMNGFSVILQWQQGGQRSNLSWNIHLEYPLFD